MENPSPLLQLPTPLSLHHMPWWQQQEAEPPNTPGRQWDAVATSISVPIGCQDEWQTPLHPRHSALALLPFVSLPWPHRHSPEGVWMAVAYWDK